MEPCDLTAVEARRLIGLKRLSPVELTDSCVRRIEAVDHAVNAVVTRDFDRARETARAREQEVMRGGPLGALHGLPVAIKDTAETGGLLTTFGSTLFRNNVPEKDERFVACLRAAGESSSARPTCRNGRPEETRAIRYSAQPAIPLIPRGRPQDRRAVRRPPSLAAWCPWRRGPTPAARCAIRPPIAAWSAFARRRALFRAKDAVPLGCRFQRSDQWAAPWAMRH